MVDDNVTNLKLIEQLLTLWGAENEIIDNAKSALNIIVDAKSQRKPFNIIIVDLGMPDMDGLQLGNEIKNSPDISDTLMMILATHGQRGDAKRFKATGFTAYRSKPLVQSALYGAITGMIDNGVERDMLSAPVNRNLMQYQDRVLVVEDNVVNQKVAQGMLEKFGIFVEAAANGREAAESLRRFPLVHA